MRLFGEDVQAGSGSGVCGIGEVDAVIGLVDSGEVDAAVSREEGASNRKLQVSPLLLQLAQLGCWTSHYETVSPMFTLAECFRKFC
jgi:hypothetical protein